MPEAQRVDVSAIIENQKLNSFLIRLVLISWVVTFFDGFDMNVLAYTAPYLVPQFHLTKIMLGNVFSASLLGTVIGAFVFGYIGDQIGRRRAIILAAAMFGVCTFILALTPGYQFLLAIRFIDGVAIGGFTPLIWALNIEYSPKQYRATIVTLIMIGYTVGIIMGGPIAVWLIPKFGWQAMFIFGGAMTLVGTLFLFGMLPESIRFLASKGRRPDLIARIIARIAPQQQVPAGAQFVVADEKGQSKDFKLSLLFAGPLRWITPMLWIAYAGSSLTVFCLSMWAPIIFESLKYTRAEAAMATSALSFAGMVGGMLLMRFTDKFGAISILVMPFMALVLLLMAAFVNVGHSGLLVVFAFIGFFVVGGHNGMHSIAGIFYPSAYRSRGTGWASGIAKAGATVGPLVGGFVLASKLPVRDLFAVLAIAPAVMVICVFIIGRVHSGILGREALLAAKPPLVKRAAVS